MAHARRSPLIAVCALGTAWMLGGCAAAPPAPAPIQEPVDDWRNLGVAPFGSQLQELHVPVHEVLLFADPEGLECYAPDVRTRTFLGRSVESYLLCYAHGRLNLVELLVSLPATGAARAFSGYCDAWQAGTEPVDARTAMRCSGTHEPGPSFRASLGESADGATIPLSIIVSDTPFSNSP
ncbi:MAG: hypothetical protein ACHQIL_02990 [Steroidobacterales bacterium]